MVRKRIAARRKTKTGTTHLSRPRGIISETCGFARSVVVAFADSFDVVVFATSIATVHPISEQSEQFSRTNPTSCLRTLRVVRTSSNPSHQLAGERHGRSYPRSPLVIAKWLPFCCQQEHSGKWFSWNDLRDACAYLRSGGTIRCQPVSTLLRIRSCFVLPCSTNACELPTWREPRPCYGAATSFLTHR